MRSSSDKIIPFIIKDQSASVTLLIRVTVADGKQDLAQGAAGGDVLSLCWNAARTAARVQPCGSLNALSDTDLVNKWK